MLYAFVSYVCIYITTKINASQTALIIIIITLLIRVLKTTRR